MKANRKFKEEVGVSAVIGVILMVAITVAIAATVYVYITSTIEDPETEKYTGVLHKVKSQGDHSKIVIGDKTLKIHGDLDCLACLVGKEVTIYVADQGDYYTFEGVEVGE